MRLIRCQIENFGKLQNVRVEFAQACHVFCEKNGWGKSTFAAFLRVMFYGFEGETKRNALDNERRRFRPWQGGTYGGQLVFEVNGRCYEVSRVFGEKKQQDTFQLRDLETNQISRDYSENLGEELFQINSESFMRTVLIRQNDCGTNTTDDMNAKLGALADGERDLAGYEAANQALQDTLNQLNPQRKTGRIAKLKAEVTELQASVRAGEMLKDTITGCEEQIQQLEHSLAEKREEQEEIYQQQRQVSRRQDMSREQLLYQELHRQYERERQSYQRIRAYFPGKIPSEEHLQKCLDLCDEMALAKKGEDSGNRGSSVWTLVLGAILAVAGLVLLLVLKQTSLIPGILVLVVGVVLLLTGLIRNKKGTFAEGQEEIQEYLRSTLNEMGMKPSGTWKLQFQEIWRNRIRLAEAKEDYDDAKGKWLDYKSQFSDAEQRELQSTISGEDSLAELNQWARQLDQECESLREKIHDAEDQLDELRERYDTWMEEKDELAEKQALLEDLTKKYRQIQMAQAYLGTAKSAMTSKYRDPLMRSFIKYYEILTSEESFDDVLGTERYHLDANGQVTVTAHGMQREVQYLSCGYQDLIGLCMRLALVDAMYAGEKPMLILDDPFVNLDDEKFSGAKKLLDRIAKEYQVIYFTCTRDRV